MKENFNLLNGDDILSKFQEFNLYSWNYIGQDAETMRHYGIMAQDFYAAFGVDAYGTIGDSTRVNPIDLLGIAYAAIKALKEENDELKQSNQHLLSRIEKIEKMLSNSNN
jgi:hypothetical protein